MNKFFGFVGFASFMLGAAGMDSESLVVPALLLLFGLVILFAVSRKEEKHGSR